MTNNERLARLEAKLETIEASLHRLIAIAEGATGLVVRLDRLEQAHSRVRKWTNASLAAALTALVAKLSAYLHIIR